MGLEAGDVITQAEFVIPEKFQDDFETTPIEFSRNEDKALANWPAFVELIQEMPQGTKVKLTYVRGDESREATLTPAVAEGYFVPERGLVFDWIQKIRIADTWGEAVERGWNETVSALGMVYRFLSKLGGQVPLTSFGGPITIVQAAGFSAFEGMGKLLVFLTMLSANLAVINFLPIPLLDGGHMVFLLWEGIRGKPAGEKFVMAMHTAGFVFIITLMLFVISLDLGLIERNL
jgi:regulator of sigma E protease